MLRDQSRTDLCTVIRGASGSTEGFFRFSSGCFARGVKLDPRHHWALRGEMATSSTLNPTTAAMAGRLLRPFVACTIFSRSRRFTWLLEPALIPDTSRRTQFSRSSNTSPSGAIYQSAPVSVSALLTATIPTPDSTVASDNPYAPASVASISLACALRVRSSGATKLTIRRCPLPDLLTEKTTGD